MSEGEKNENLKKNFDFFVNGLYNVGWEPIVEGEFKAKKNGKEVTAPLSVYKSQREVFIAEKTKKQIEKDSGFSRGEEEEIKSQNKSI